MGRQKEFSRGARVMLLGIAPPEKPYIRPRHPHAEVRWSDGTWRRVTIRAWCRPPGGYRTIMSADTFTWLVFLRFPEGMGSEDSCYCHDPQLLRSVSPPE